MTDDRLRTASPYPAAGMYLGREQQPQPQQMGRDLVPPPLPAPASPVPSHSYFPHASSSSSYLSTRGAAPPLPTPAPPALPSYLSQQPQQQQLLQRRRPTASMVGPRGSLLPSEAALLLPLRSVASTSSLRGAAKTAEAGPEDGRRATKRKERTPSLDYVAAADGSLKPALPPIPAGPRAGILKRTRFSLAPELMRRSNSIASSGSGSGSTANGNKDQGSRSRSGSLAEHDDEQRQHQHQQGPQDAYMSAQQAHKAQHDAHAQRHRSLPSVVFPSLSHVHAHGHERDYDEEAAAAAAVPVPTVPSNGYTARAVSRDGTLAAPLMHPQALSTSSAHAHAQGQGQQGQAYSMLDRVTAEAGYYNHWNEQRRVWAYRTFERLSGSTASSSGGGGSFSSASAAGPFGRRSTGGFTSTTRASAVSVATTVPDGADEDEALEPGEEVDGWTMQSNQAKRFAHLHGRHGQQQAPPSPHSRSAPLGASARKTGADEEEDEEKEDGKLSTTPEEDPRLSLGYVLAAAHVEGRPSTPPVLPARSTLLDDDEHEFEREGKDMSAMRRRSSASAPPAPISASSRRRQSMAIGKGKSKGKSSSAGGPERARIVSMTAEEAREHGITLEEQEGVELELQDDDDDEEEEEEELEDAGRNRASSVPSSPYASPKRVLLSGRSPAGGGVRLRIGALIPRDGTGYGHGHGMDEASRRQSNLHNSAFVFATQVSPLRAQYSQSQHSTSAGQAPAPPAAAGRAKSMTWTRHSTVAATAFLATRASLAGSAYMNTSGVGASSLARRATRGDIHSTDSSAEQDDRTPHHMQPQQSEGEYHESPRGSVSDLGHVLSRFDALLERRTAAFGGMSQLARGAEELQDSMAGLLKAQRELLAQRERASPSAGAGQGGAGTQRH